MKITRRQFSKSAGAVALSGLLSPHIVTAQAKDPMQRIAMTTVTFRARFAQTKIKKHPPVVPLKLLEVPEYYADRFKVHNVEFWSRHFESLDAAYLADLKRQIGKAKARLINIQIDERYNLADANEEKRQQSIALVKKWIDAAVTLGAASARANTGRGDLERCIQSFRELTGYAREKGLVLLSENHGGLSSNPDNLLKIVQAVNKKNLQILPDFGNFAPDIRMTGLRKIIPHAKHLISAKAKQFDDKWNHTLYDYDKCAQLAQSLGFPGFYSAEYYDGSAKPLDYEKVADWMIEHLKANLS